MVIEKVLQVVLSQEVVPVVKLPIGWEVSNHIIIEFVPGLDDQWPGVGAP